MAIVVNYTPVQAMGELAVRAGQAEFEKSQAAFREKQQLMQMQQDFQMKQQRFMVEAEQQARAEEMQYQALLMQQKRQIDMQIEVSDFARQKQKLAQTLGMINESDKFNAREKEELRLQAMSRYADVGQGITQGSFDTTGGASGFENFMLQGTYKAQIVNSLQEAVRTGKMSQPEAQRQAAAFGLGQVEFQTKTEEAQTVMDTAQKRLATAIARLDDSFMTKGDTVYTKVGQKPGNKIKPKDPEYKLYETLQKQVDAAREETERLRTEVSQQDSQDQFNLELESSPQLQQAVEIYGSDVVYKRWVERQGSRQPAEPENEPMFKITPKNLIPGYGVYQTVKGMIY